MCRCSCSDEVKSLLERMRTLEQRVRDLESSSASDAPKDNDDATAAPRPGTRSDAARRGQHLEHQGQSKKPDEEQKKGAQPLLGIDNSFTAPSGTDGAASDGRAISAKDSSGNGKGSSTVPRPLSAQEIPASATRVVMQQLCRPLDCDQLGVCFGGTVMSWVDLCAGLSSKMAARGACVTASLDAVHFVRPLKINTIAIIEAMVNCTFSSSMEIGVRVSEEDPHTGERNECCHAYLTFVSLRSLRRTDNPDPKPLPRLVPSSPEQKAAQEEAAGRRAKRLAKRDASRQASARARDPHLPPKHYKHRAIVVPDTRGLRREASKQSSVSPDKNNLSSETVMTVQPNMTLSHTFERVLPPHANTMGITFGGQVLSWVERAAYLSAIRLNLSGHMLTAALDDVTFKEPTRVGDVLYFTSVVTAVFTSSVEVMVSVFGEHPLLEDANEEPFFVVDAYVTLVSVGRAGQPQRLHTTLQPTSEVEQSRMEAAQQRRMQRLELRRAFVAQALNAVKAINASTEADRRASFEQQP